VDSTAGLEDAEAVVQILSEKFNCVIAATGRIDFVAFKKRFCVIRNGHEMLSRITGAGCMTTSLLGTCLGAVDDPWIAAATGIASMGIAGEMAQRNLQSHEGNGTFKSRLLDCISRLSPKILKESARIEFCAR
jgi:hydroxyethylthiazole kinase